MQGNVIASDWHRSGERNTHISGWRFKWENTVVGVNPLVAASKRGILRRLVLTDDERRKPLVELSNRLGGASLRRAKRAEFETLDLPEGHQTCIGEIVPLENPDVREAVPDDGASLVIMLDGVTDPQNAGAIIRTAAVVGASAVVLPGRRSAGPGPTLFKASAGFAFHIPLCRGTNLGVALARLAEVGFWSVAAVVREEGALPLQSMDFPERCVLVLGSEGKGISKKLIEKCDQRVFIPTAPLRGLGVDSLNVSVAAGILSYAWLAATGWEMTEGESLEHGSKEK